MLDRRGNIGSRTQIGMLHFVLYDESKVLPDELVVAITLCPSLRLFNSSPTQSRQIVVIDRRSLPFLILRPYAVVVFSGKAGSLSCSDKLHNDVR